jgi:multidrug resistance efflux pump
MVILAAVGGGLYAFRAQLAEALGGGGGGTAATVVKTAPVTRGTLERTIRLTGTTVAERAASLVAPQLRGGRGGGGGGGVQVTGGRGGGMTITISAGGGGMGGMSSGGGGGSSSSTSSTSSASSAVASALSGASSMGSSAGGATGMTAGTSGSAGATSGFRSSGTSRFSSGASSSRPSSGGSSSVASSASASSGGGGGGGFSGGGDMTGMSGGMSDFMQVLQKAAEPGAMVRKGDVVAEFDRQYQEQRLDDFRSTVEQGETNMRRVDAELEVTRKSRELSIEQARAAVEKAKLDMKTTPVRSQIQAETLKLQLEEAEARLQQLLAEVKFQQISEQAQRRNTELTLEASRKELEMAQRNIDRMIMKAPMDGMVVMQQTFRGGEFSQIKQGDQLLPGQLFMQIVDPASMVVAASINQADVELLRVGARARLHFDAFPGMELPGHVISIGAMTKTGGQRADYVKEIPVMIKVDKVDPRVIPDLTVSADVVVEEARDEILAPLESVHWDGGAGQPYVFVRTASGFEKRPVQLGLTNHVKAAVKSGLKEGESVATERPPEKKSGGGKDPVAAARPGTPSGEDYVKGS